MRCQARQFSDQMICGRCGLQWDVNDPDPPACRQHKEPIKRKESAQQDRNPPPLTDDVDRI